MQNFPSFIYTTFLSSCLFWVSILGSIKAIEKVLQYIWMVKDLYDIETRNSLDKYPRVVLLGQMLDLALAL